jgi:membrane-associated phospholipid phosphatase
VGLYVFVAYLVLIAGDPSATFADTRALDMAHDLRTTVGVDIAKVVTTFGSLPVTGGLVIASAVVLAVRRRPIELCVLVFGFLAIYLAVHITKGAVDRPRPPHPLTGSTGSAFPSGHAAYSTAYVAMAVIAARVLPGNFSRALLVILATAFAAVIGGTRIFLGVHWFSDVAAGWGLGAAIFGFAAAIGLIVGYFRNNEEPPPGPAGPPARAAPQSVV